MFEKEYLTQKFILFVSMLFILGFIGKNYLSEKNGISASEGLTYAISSTCESLADSPYGASYYNKQELEDNVSDIPMVFSLYHISLYLKDIIFAPEQSAILSNGESVNYTNQDWIDNSYYENLLSVSRDKRFQYDMVRKNCITTQKAPLYYYVLHTVSSIFGSLSLTKLGFSINAVFLLFSAFLFLEICRNHLRASWAGLASAIFFSLSLGCCSGTICATPYLMVIFFLLFSTYLHLTALKSREISLLTLEILTAVHVFGNLTDYSYTFCSLALCICFCIFMLLIGNGREIWKYLLANVISLLITFVLYPASLLHLTTIFSNGIRKLMHNFDFDVFHQNCMSNISVLNTQLFFRTSLLVGALLFVLLLLAIILKKETFQSHYEDFAKRFEDGEIGDFFIPAFGMLYFGFVTFLYGADDYFILITLLPFVSIMFCYLGYRLSNAAMHSEFNSGIFGVAIVCLLCFITCTTSTPEYTYADELAKTQFAETYQDQYCIFLSSEELHAADHILELKNYKHSIVTTKEQLKALKKNKEFLEQKQILVYLSIEDYTSAEMDKIAKYGKFHLTEELTSYLDENSNRIYVYQLRKIK